MTAERSSPPPADQRQVVAMLEEAQRRLAEVESQRDEYAYRLRRSKSTRWGRLGQALREARRSWKALLLLPVTMLRIIFGPPVVVDRGAEPGAAMSPDISTPPPGTAVALSPRAQFLTAPGATQLSELRVAGIVDEFTARCLEPECRLLVDFRPDNWRESLERFKPDLVFIESAWKGNGGSWQYQVGRYSYTESVGLPHLSALTRWARANSVPTVFWNKEDPVHFDRFRDAAVLTDVVLTTDANCIPAYQALPGLSAERVDALPFAAQPRIHSPLGAPDSRDARCVFAGSYYRNRHVDRRRQLEVLLRSGAERGLVIFDRNNGVISEDVGFPEEFRPYIQGGLPYDEMLEAYRHYRVFLNVNSVVDSPTMCSRRVFEILSAGTPVVSTPSPAIERLLPGVVDQADDPQSARQAIDRLLDDDDHWLQRSLNGRRAVLRSHTYAHRLARVAAAAGVAVTSDADAGVTTIIAASDLEAANRHLEALARLRPTGTVLVLGGSPDAPTVAHAGRRDIPTADDPQRTLRNVAAAAGDNWLLILGDGPPPDHDLLVDLEVARQLVSADAIGIVGTAPDRFVTTLGGSPALVRRQTVRDRGWPVDDPAGQARLHERGIRMFSVRGTATSA